MPQDINQVSLLNQYACASCGAFFYTYNSLQMHYGKFPKCDPELQNKELAQLAEAYKPEPHTCRGCATIFSSNSALTRHENLCKKLQTQETTIEEEAKTDALNYLFAQGIGVDFCVGTIITLATRIKHGNMQLKDIEKIRHYLSLLEERYKKVKAF